METPEQICLQSIKSLLGVLNNPSVIAAAVSGGPDSMALAWILSHHAEELGLSAVHVLCVDHGLRDESQRESEGVKNTTAAWPNVFAHVLKRDVDPAHKESRIQEAARDDRYALMEGFCRQNGVWPLFLGHHMDDQIETFFLRLLKGSGPEGLAGMQSIRPMSDHVQLVRPFLGVPKVQLAKICEEQNIPYISDPSNENEKFTRVRIRKLRDDLAQEGASDEMLSKSIFRLREFVDVVDFYTEKAWGEIVLNKHPNRIVMKFSLLVTQPQGMVLRLLKKAYAEIHAGQDGYGPRRDKLERIVGELCHAPEHFERQTLGGCILTLNEKDDTFTLELEG